MALVGTVPLVAEFRRRLDNRSKSWKFHRASNFKGRAQVFRLDWTIAGEIADVIHLNGTRDRDAVKYTETSLDAQTRLREGFGAKRQHVLACE
jgi:hypothetical protein